MVSVTSCPQREYDSGSRLIFPSACLSSTTCLLAGFDKKPRVFYWRLLKNTMAEIKDVAQLRSAPKLRFA